MAGHSPRRVQAVLRAARTSVIRPSIRGAVRWSRMQRWTQAQFDELAAGAKSLSADEHGAKVLLTPDDRVIKLFRRKRLLSSALFHPYAKRFAHAAQELAARHFPTTTVETLARVPSMRRDIVVYRRLPGISLREALLCGREADRERLMLILTNLLATLHERGVYFRAAHFGNFLVHEQPPDTTTLTLIDVSETRFRRGALPPAMRARNFRPLAKYPEDLAAIRAFGVERFVRDYLDHAHLSPVHVARFRSALQSVHKVFACG